MLIAAGLLTLYATTGCSSATEQYCSTLDEEEQTLRELGTGTGGGGDRLGETIDTFERLRSEAPDDVVDEWNTVIFATESLRESLGQAGVDPGAFLDGEPPEGVSEEELAVIEGAAGRLRSDQVLSAGADIEQHARNICEVELEL